MAGLFDIVNRRRRSRELADKFREGATPEELEYFDRFYQEPSSNPVWAEGALEGELDAADAMQRALMARGMNALQADDKIKRDAAEREAAFVRSRELYQQAHPNEGVAASSPLSYQRYTEDFAPYTQTDDQGVETTMTGDRMSEQEFLNKQIARQRLAGDTSAAADARYKSETVDDRISMIEQQAASLPGELDAKGASAEVTAKLMGEISRLLGKAIEDPENATIHIDKAQELLRVTKAATSGGFSSYGGPQRHIDDDIEEGTTSLLGKVLGVTALFGTLALLGSKGR